MSFVRPSVKEMFWRWREVLLLLAILGASAYFAVTKTGLTQIIGGGLAVIAILFLWPTIRQARMPFLAPGAGVVEITERRIRYLGPERGGEVSVNDLVSIEIAKLDPSADGEDTIWVLTDKSGTELMIPAGAEGAEGLHDAFSAISGVNYDNITRAMLSETKNLFVIWEKA